MKPKIFGLFFLLFVFTITGLYAETDEELLARVDSLASYMDSDFSAQYTFIQERPGQTTSVTVAAVYRRDSREIYTIVIAQPQTSKGQGYLKEGNTLWLYDPQSRNFNTTSSKDRFQNTNASNSDFTRSTLAQDYRVVAGENVSLEIESQQFQCRLLTLEAVTSNVTYQKMKVWISSDGLLRKSEDKSLSGQLLRTSTIYGYYNIGGRYVPKQILLEDELRGAEINGIFKHERTLIRISMPSFANIPDAYFSTKYLEDVNR